MLKFYIGWDSREVLAWRVLENSIHRHAKRGLEVHPVILGDLQYRGLYNRPMSMKGGRLFDEISDAPMSTEFAISRFLVPQLCGTGWAVFMDCDMLAVSDLTDLTHYLDDNKAVMCVQHRQDVINDTKMDGQAQLPYERKNWSSFMAFNCDHPANKKLTVKMVNQVPGRDLHRFCWLDDKHIGALPQGWNWLEGYSPETRPLHVVHYTRGGPWMKDWQHVEFADLWLREKAIMEGNNV